jgi:hypothetical protein
MTYRQAKGFFVFWIILAIVWLLAGARTYQVSDGMQVNWLYFAAAAISTTLALYYLQGIKR